MAAGMHWIGDRAMKNMHLADEDRYFDLQSL